MYQQSESSEWLLKVFLDDFGFKNSSCCSSIFKNCLVDFSQIMMKVFNSKGELEEHVRKSRHALILFCASWCPFCREFFPAFEKMVVKNDFDTVLRVYVDDYDNPLWEDYSIDAVPTVMLLEEGKVKSRLDSRLGSGLSEKTFNEWIRRT